ncbi:MAG: serine hydrolase domain-containing protein [Sphingomonadaceae bacterium]
MRLILGALLLALASLSVVVAQSASTVTMADPEGWTREAQTGLTLFTAPEGDFRVAVVEVGAAQDARAAVGSAWTRLRPGTQMEPLVVSPAGPGSGWEERQSFAYETAPEERATRSALALRRGADWVVMLIDGAQATQGKRLAAISLVQQSLRPAGYQPENFAGRQAHRLTPERVEQMRQFVARAAETLGVPGVGVALVEQGKVVWEGGHGVRALGSPEPVDAHTKFMIASNTKPLATLLLAILADDGRLAWDQRAVDVYPAFRLGTPETTNATLVRHLVCACTGLPRKDFAFILADPGAPASDTFRQLAETVPTSGFGELFQYNNLMASAAGYIGGALSYPRMELGAAFDRAMDQRIFRPLGMRDTGFDFGRGMAGNWAAPHGVDLDGRTVRLSNDFNRTVEPHRPAGGAFSSAADMARYVQLELSGGVAPGGKRLVSRANLLERRKRGVSVGENNWYGMGLFDRVAWGVPVVTHGGTLQGYHSSFFLLPEAGIGAVILTNADPGAAMIGPFLRRLIELLYDGAPEAEQEVAAAAERLKAQTAARRSRLTLPPDPKVLAGLATAYRAPEGLSLRFFPRDGATWVQAGFVESPVATRVNPDGTVSVVSSGPGLVGFEALVGEDGGGRTLTVRDAQHSYVYRAAE